MLAAILTLSLAGCFGPPEVPSDATIAVNDALPGLTMSAWTEDVGGRIRMLALVENDGPETYDIRVGCGEPWRSHLTSPLGEEIHYREVLEEPGCPTYWDVLRPNAELETLYSWNFKDHDLDEGTSTPVPAGVYDWILQFTLRDSDEVLETRIPIRVDPPNESPLGGFHMALATGTVGSTYGVNVTVHNGGATSPTFWTGCGMEWNIRILDADGDEVPQRDVFTCEGFTETTFPAGDTVYAEFFWNSTTYAGDADHLVPAGTYQWEVTFGLQGTAPDQGPTMTQRAAFEVRR